MHRALLQCIVVCGLAAAPATAQDNPLYPEVSRILSRHCLQCHGPDANQREAGLRLDEKGPATRNLASGLRAIVPGNARSSELLRRVQRNDDTRMPPVEAGRSLTPDEIDVLTRWIESGANFETHWSFSPPGDPPVPTVQNSGWSSRPLDRFVLNRMEQAGEAPLPAADRRVLIRRAYFDMIGLPPTPDQVNRFVSDDSPEAWAKVVNELLSSPLYGQRWGRHWLDVVRYGDSNGSDENHAYPLAWRYRNYVIDAINDDVPFDRFVREQLAGDLIADPQRMSEGLTATGFLAIGTKILAEKDPVKKQADMVDEQIDTLGKALLGFTVACARCHDHKFDPIPTKDYYALAGILHSTRLQERALDTPEYKAARKDFDARLAALDQQQREVQKALSRVPGAFIDREAETFDRGNAVRVTSGYGEGIGIISDPGKGVVTFAEWDFQLRTEGEYVLQFRFAAQDSRPGSLTINGTLVTTNAVSDTTGGWMPPNQKWITQGRFKLRKGVNTVRFESAPCMSHIDRIRLVSTEARGIDESLKRLTELSEQREALIRDKPKPAMAMAVTDGMPADVRVHVRGSHLKLGDKVARGFPSIAGVSSVENPFHVPADQSGRAQLANWITDPHRGAGGQLARVFVNRVWHWHFGSGLVRSTNNFGLQGQRPTHPRLLNWLTTRFVQDGWSLKALHRRILLSETYRQRSVPTRSELLVGFTRRRLEAESIRDTLLFHSGRLDTTQPDALQGVVTQNPSPEDLQKNEEFHRRSNHRSVYLPVVRSNAYRFLTLFDFPNAATSVGRRDVTTVPTQALLMMNDPFVMDAAAHLAKSVTADQPERQISVVYNRLFNRPPRDVEQRTAEQFLRDYTATAGNPAEALAALCQALMASGEFLYVD